MELPLGNFFQVTVDAHRLSAWMEDLQRQIRVQSDRTDELSRVVTGITNSLGARLKKSEESIEEQLERMRLATQQENNYFRLFMKDADKKTSDKITEFENSLVMLNNRITITRQALQDDLSLRLSFIEKKIANPQPDLQAEERSRNHLDNVVKAAMKTLQGKMDERIMALEEARAKGEDEVFQMRRAQSSKNISSFTRSRKRLKSHRKATLYQNQNDIDQIVNKISQLENRIQQQRDQKQEKLLLSNNRIIKISQNLTSVNGVATQDSAGKINDLVTTVGTRLARLEEAVVERVTDCERSLTRLANRTEINEEQVGIVVRKFQKEKTKIAQVIAGFKRLEERKVDDRAIEQLRISLKKLGKEVEEGLESKVACELFDQQRKTVQQRFQTLFDNLAEKAEKSEVKRGFTFLEEKIKEMILVLAEEKSANNDGALKKTAFKCLSCDKDLEVTPSEPFLAPRMGRDSANSSARCSTNQIRKRIRMVNNSLNNEDS